MYLIYLFSLYTNSCVDRYFLISKNRKKFFLDFARGRGFDPLISESWYSVRASDFLENEVNYSYKQLFIKKAYILIFRELTRCNTTAGTLWKL
jgi:hypothetical protein